LQYFNSKSSAIPHAILDMQPVLQYLLQYLKEYCSNYYNNCNTAILTTLINSNLSHISHRFRDMATCRLKLISTENCGQSAADKDMVTINNL